MNPALRGSRRPALVLAVALTASTALFVLGGFWYYARTARALYQDRAAALRAVADMKIGQLSLWKKERLADAHMNATGLVRLHAAEWLNSANTIHTQTILKERLEFLRKEEDYADILMASPDGRLLLSLDPSLKDLERPGRDLVRRAIAAKAPVFSDFSLSRGRVVLDVAAPIMRRDRVLAVLILRSDPERFLFPLLQSWPLPSQSAETFLVRREGDEVLVLNRLRHRPDPPLTLRLPLAARTPASFAIQSGGGLYEGLDYRGRRVLADAQAVSGTSWFLVSKMDAEEILAELHYRAWSAGIVVALTTIMMALLAALLLALRGQKHQRALDSSEARYQRLVEGLRHEYFFYRHGVDGVFSYLSDSVTNVLGYAPAEFMTHFSTYMTDHPLNREVFRHTELSVKGEQQPPYLVELRHKDGSRRWLQVLESPVFDERGQVSGVEGIAHDITEARRTHEALAESEARFRSLFDHMVDGYCLLDPATSRFILWNRALCEMLGYGPEEAAGLPVAAIHRPEDMADIEAAFRTMTLTGARRGKEFELLRKDASTVTAEVRGAAADIGGCKLVAGIFRDLTELKKLQAELLQSQKMESVGRLAGGVAHDFNNLLTAINGYAQCLLDALPEGQPAREDAREIVEAGRRAAALTQQLLAFSRRQIVKPEIVDVNAAVAGTLKMLGRLLGENISFQTRLAGRPCPVLIDRGQLDQLLVNLAVNARDAMPDGGTLTIATEAAGPDLRLTVSDTGAGIDQETLAHIFEPFFTTKTRSRGTGLGLATVYGIVKQCGGDIEVDSSPGRGTSFRIRLPLREPGPQPAAPARNRTPAGGGETILLAEDEAALRGLAKKVLESAGYTVLEAADGPAALRALAAHDRTVHLLLTDVVMPGMNGRELAREAARLRPGLRTLYTSGYTDDAIVRHGVLDFGVAFLYKPFTPDELAAKVRAVLDGPADQARP